MEADIEAGKVAHVIVKDMSRIGRDYLQTGFYTEVFFREHGVHFIAIANSVDSDDQNSNEFAPLENALQKPSEQEAKYSAELDAAMKQYADLKAQTADVDAVDLMDARLAVREEQERSVTSRVKSAYGEKYDPMMMQDSKRDVANLFNEETEARSIRERLRQKQQAQQKQNKKKSRDRWER